MGIPRKLRVGAFTYTVGRAKAPDLGHTDSDDLHINVSPDAHDLVAKSTLLHEALHAVVSDSGLKPRWDEDEELYVGVLERGLFNLLRDNPAFVEYVTS